ncbi:MAG: hypothetical protein GJU73_01850 [Ferrovum sp.]|uniref:hypothetical protein n=1 Tax=Ferrovum sp. TaxID=2609467 RepID=UPI002618AA63|nr:hypothetical protein [Ferrovum sp.]MBW8066162.1 hypothetical protein [Ferrovum sp.]
MECQDHEEVRKPGTGCREPASAGEKGSAVVTGATVRLIGDSQAPVDQAFNALQRDLTQVDALLKDAVGQLMESLLRLQSLMQEQQKIIGLAVSEEGNQDGNPAPGRESFRQVVKHQTEFNGRIEDAVFQAVTSLQFQDMVTQLVDNIQIRLSALRDIHQLIAHQAGSEHSASQRADEALVQTISSLERKLAALRECQVRKPVRQADMASGEIELF